MLSSSTDSEGDNGRGASGQAQGNANDSDDIQTISSGSDEEPGGDGKKNLSSRLGESGWACQVFVAVGVLFHIPPPIQILGNPR